MKLTNYMYTTICYPTCARKNLELLSIYYVQQSVIIIDIVQQQVVTC